MDSNGDGCGELPYSAWSVEGSWIRNQRKVREAAMLVFRQRGPQWESTERKDQMGPSLKRRREEFRMGLKRTAEVAVHISMWDGAQTLAGPKFNTPARSSYEKINL